MIINFRQGIIQKQTSPSFLSFVGGIVSLNRNTQDTIVSFAYGTDNYLFREAATITNAWIGPFQSGTDYWLYWDIDLFSGERTFGITLLEPLNGSVYPNNPGIGQHFFDQKEKIMKEWNGSKWNHVIRVFAAKLSSGAILEEYTVGSQVGLSGVNSAGYLLFTTEGEPIKTSDRFGRGRFITTETFLSSQDDPNNTYKLQRIDYSFKAVENIPAFHGVCIKGINQIGLASSEFPEFPCIGVATEEILKDEIKFFTTNGIIENINWNFLENPGNYIWLGKTGELISIMPVDISAQKIAIILTNNTILLDIQDQYLIDPEI